MHNIDDCLFCKMATGQIAPNKIYEDGEVLAFHDIDPKAPVHFLVIPKQHIKSAADITSENSAIIGKIFEVIAKISKDMNLEDGFRVVTNCGVDGGQSVGHLHYHVLAKRRLSWPPG